MNAPSTILPLACVALTLGGVISCTTTEEYSIHSNSDNQVSLQRTERIEPLWGDFPEDSSRYPRGGSEGSSTWSQSVTTDLEATKRMEEAEQREFEAASGR